MLKHAWILVLVGCSLVNAPLLRADLILSVGDVVLRPNTANQEIPVFARFLDAPTSSIATVGGLQMYVRLGDGSGIRGTQPVFQGLDSEDNSLGVSFDGTVWDGGEAKTIVRPIWEGFGQYAGAFVVFNTRGDSRLLTTSDQLVAKLRVDTTGVTSGTFAVQLDDGVNDPSHFFSDSGDKLLGATRLQNGSFTVAVPESGAVWALVMSSAVGIFGRRSRLHGS